MRPATKPELETVKAKLIEARNAVYALQDRLMRTRSLRDAMVTTECAVLQTMLAQLEAQIENYPFRDVNPRIEFDPFADEPRAVSVRSESP